MMQRLQFQGLEAIISKGEYSTGKCAAVLKMIRGYGSGGLGNVVFASGHQNENGQGHRMDWAITKLRNQDLEVNNLPVPDYFNSEQRPTNGDYEVEEGERVRRIADPEKGAWVAKIGRITGVTSGIVNAIEAYIHWGNKKTTREWYVENKFGSVHVVNGGDSGSMVINQKKEWVGMVIMKVGSLRN